MEMNRNQSGDGLRRDPHVSPQATMARATSRTLVLQAALDAASPVAAPRRSKRPTVLPMNWEGGTT